MDPLLAQEQKLLLAKGESYLLARGVAFRFPGLVLDEPWNCSGPYEFALLPPGGVSRPPSGAVGEFAPPPERALDPPWMSRGAVLELTNLPYRHQGVVTDPLR